MTTLAPPRKPKMRKPKRPRPRSKGLVVPLEELVTNAGARWMCGGVTRHTLLRWRELEDFPAPVLITDGLELWDAREVRAWMQRRH